ncbi:conserved hypothetical protein [Mesorhizobium metallidurans STM 2683]|uniref:Uncharacterized protein n=3 Tax=Mesorhizobium TaxID=68287 RepID=A0A1R3VAV5_9HYPH|nr:MULTISPECIES: hypothetical protein [Mesorhizobium]CAH2399207.1 conserved hypothetical protein [Mesorhizobium escarrei]CCV09373.1 conserved hypothetical protein [Mesorhizobium metallidurans STM 2683]SIT55918.1 conserved hypothetical protein [Mesorhizobium prunaredense]
MLDHDLGAALVQIGNDGVAIEPRVGVRIAEGDALDGRAKPTVSKRPPDRRTKHASAERIGEGKDLSCRPWEGLWPGFDSPFALPRHVHQLIRPAMSAAVARLRDEPFTTSAAEV